MTMRTLSTKRTKKIIETVPVVCVLTIKENHISVQLTFLGNK